MKHPNLALTEDGKDKAYIYGDTSGVAFPIEPINDLLFDEDSDPIETGYVFLSEEDVEKQFKK